MYRKTTPLVPIFNPKKRSREAVIAEPGDHAGSTTFPQHVQGDSNNDPSLYMECGTGRQMYQTAPDSFHNNTWEKDQSFCGQRQQSSGTWGNDQSFPGQRQQNSGMWGNDQSFHGQRQQNSGTWGNDQSFHGNQQQKSGIHSNIRFQQQQQSGAGPQRGGGNSCLNQSSLHQSRNSQPSLHQSRNSQRSGMELLPPNPPNPKSARYSQTQQSAESGNSYSRPLERGQGRGTVNRGERVQQNATRGRGRGNVNFNATSSVNVSGSGFSGRSYQDREQTYSGNRNDWNVGGGYNRERTGRVDTQLYDGDESLYHGVDGGWQHPDIGASGSVCNMDRRYAPIVSSFQTPGACGDGSGPDSVSKDPWFQSVWATKQQQGYEAQPQNVNNPSKTETKPVQKPALDRSLRIVATDLGGIKNWEHLRGSLSFLFEIFVQVNSATSKLPETEAKKFCVKEDSATMDCIFYEIDHSLPKLTRGKIYRIIGSYDSNHDWIKCSSIREATQNEHAAHQKNVQICAQYKLKLSSVVREQ